MQNSYQACSHWVMYNKSDIDTIAYSSFGDPAHQERIDYFGDKEKREMEESRGSGALPFRFSLGPFPSRKKYTQIYTSDI